MRRLLRDVAEGRDLGAEILDFTKVDPHLGTEASTS